MANCTININLASIEPKGKSSYTVKVNLGTKCISSLVIIDPDEPPLCGLRLENNTLSRFLFLTGAMDQFSKAIFSSHAKREITLPLTCAAVDSEKAMSILGGLEQGESIDELHKKFPMK